MTFFLETFSLLGFWETILSDMPSLFPFLAPLPFPIILMLVALTCGPPLFSIYTHNASDLLQSMALNIKHQKYVDQFQTNIPSLDLSSELQTITSLFLTTSLECLKSISNIKF